jgi:hypothetical protein
MDSCKNNRSAVPAAAFGHTFLVFLAAGYGKHFVKKKNGTVLVDDIQQHLVQVDKNIDFLESYRDSYMENQLQADSHSIPV